MSDYYSNPFVRSRMLEYLGGTSLRDSTAEYLTVGDAEQSGHRIPRDTAELPGFWQSGLDISRSLWDRSSLIAHLDLEYVNFDYPSEVYLHPRRVFEMQRPVELAAQALCLDFGITPLHLLSGRGHHFVWRIRQNTEVFRRLAKLGRVPESLKAMNETTRRFGDKHVTETLESAFAGLGIVMEYFASRVKSASSAQCEIPVELTAVEVGPRQQGREMVAIDISEYGDPLSSRVIRVPFSIYLKPAQQRYALGNDVISRLSRLYLIPLQEIDTGEGLRVMRDESAVEKLAERVSCIIPDNTEQTGRLIDFYEKSKLSDFHKWFYFEAVHLRDRWPQTYDAMRLDSLPICTRHVLSNPNDLLLKPGHIKQVLHVLLALGWHPRHVAGLMCSKFARDYHWGDAWDGYDPASRAEFYIRVFAGEFVTGIDDLVDFNCQSAKEEKLCLSAECPFNLFKYKQSLLNRRRYERLARRPINRLFFPEEHTGVS